MRLIFQIIFFPVFLVVLIIGVIKYLITGKVDLMGGACDVYFPGDWENN